MMFSDESVVTKMNFKLDPTNDEHVLIDAVINHQYVPFMELKIPIYDQLIYLHKNKRISLRSLNHCLHSYLEYHCYGKCGNVPEVAFMHWTSTPKYSKCEFCNHILNMDYAVNVYVKNRYCSKAEYIKSKKNLKKIEEKNL